MLLLFLVQPLYAAETREIRRILVLFSEDKGHPAHELTDRGTREAFQSNKLIDVQLYTEYLDLSRFKGTANLLTVADYLHNKCAGLKIDVIIGLYPAAVDLLLSETEGAFPGVPIVACEVSNLTPRTWTTPVREPLSLA